MHLGPTAGASVPHVTAVAAQLPALRIGAVADGQDTVHERRFISHIPVLGRTAFHVEANCFLSGCAWQSV